jgi:hypothetical protein
MFQVFYLDVSKVDLGKDMLQWSRWLEDNGLPRSPVGAPSWVTVRVPMAGKWLCSART